MSTAGGKTLTTSEEADLFVPFGFAHLAALLGGEGKQQGVRWCDDTLPVMPACLLARMLSDCCCYSRLGVHRAIGEMKS